MALASCPAFQGQQRSFRRMRQVLSWALARSPGARSFAWARLAAFCEGGLPLALVRGDHVLARAVVALVGQHHQAGGGQRAEDAPDPGRAQVVHAAGQRPGDPQDLAARAASCS
jgi:hypothetical protein